MILLLALTAQAGGFDLEITDVAAAGVAHFTLLGVTPGATAGVARGRGAGDGPCFPLLAGDCFGVTRPSLIGTGVADGSGTVRLPLVIPGGASPGMPVWFQAFEAGRGVSAPAVVEVGPPVPGVDPVSGLIGNWTLVAAGPPVTAVPPETVFYAFYEDGSLSLESCGPPMGTWEVSPDGRIRIDLGFDLVWTLVALDDDDFVFSEGGDRFYAERRPGCE